MQGRGRKNIDKRNVFRRMPGMIFLCVAVLLVLLAVLMCAVACNGNDDAEEYQPQQSAGDANESDDEGTGDVENGEKSELKQFDSVIFEDATVVYDGKAHTIEPQGLPFGTSVKYSPSKCVDVGEYRIAATLKLAGYESRTVFATLHILPAVVNVSFRSRTFVWDGKPHSIYINGDLPDDAAVEYEGNECVDVGDHTVVAHVYLNKNYLPVGDLTATLTIAELVYVVSFEHWDGSVEERFVPMGRTLSEEDIPANMGREGYLEMIWDPDDLEKLKHIDSDMTVHEISGEAKSYRVILDPSGGIVPVDEIYDRYFLKLEHNKILFYYTAEDDIALLAPEHCLGLPFVGWYDEEGRRITHLPDEAGLRNMVLTAHWKGEAELDTASAAARAEDILEADLKRAALGACFAAPRLKRKAASLSK